MGKTGLVMEGGAMRGMFTCGVIDVLMENDIWVDGAIGVSAGAGFGCNYVSKQPYRPYRYIMRYCKDYRFASMISLLLTGDLYNNEFIYHRIPDKLDPFDFDTFENSPIDFYSVCTDLVTGKALYHKFKNGKGKEMEWMRGSASLPIVSKPIRVDGKVLLDGGLSDSIPLKFFEKKGYDKNIVVLTRPSFYVKEPASYMPIVKVVLKDYPNAIKAIENRPAMYNNTVRYIKKREKEGAAFVIRPRGEVRIGSVSHNRKELRRVYLMGRETAQQRLNELKEWMNK